MSDWEKSEVVSLVLNANAGVESDHVDAKPFHIQQPLIRAILRDEELCRGFGEMGEHVDQGNGFDENHMEEIVE